MNAVTVEFADNEAVVLTFENQRLTCRVFRMEVDRVARALLALGIAKGEHVGIWSTNCVSWVLAQFATAKIGAVLVTINPAYRLHELEFALRQSECNVLISGEGFKDACYREMLLTLIPELATATAPEDLHSFKFPILRRLISLAAKPGMSSWQEILSRADQVAPGQLAARQAELDFDDVINIQYTSGTTGFPKGAMLTHHNILNNGFWIGERMCFTHRDRLCISVPFYHSFGIVLPNFASVTHPPT